MEVTAEELDQAIHNVEEVIQQLDEKQEKQAPAPQAISFEDVQQAIQMGDFPKALQMLTQLANQGDAEAQIELGDKYFSGHGVIQDFKEAARWYHKAAEQGHPVALYDLAYAYCHGQGVPQDYCRASILYRKVAEHGYAEAQFALAQLYCFGRGVDVDDHEAMKWYLEAAEQGHPEAQFNLAVMQMLGGNNESERPSEAIKWFFKAGQTFIEHGNQEQALAACKAIRRIDPSHELAAQLQASIATDRLDENRP